MRETLLLASDSRMLAHRLAIPDQWMIRPPGASWASPCTGKTSSWPLAHPRGTRFPLLGARNAGLGCPRCFWCRLVAHRMPSSYRRSRAGCGGLAWRRWDWDATRLFCARRRRKWLVVESKLVGLSAIPSVSRPARTRWRVEAGRCTPVVALPPAGARWQTGASRLGSTRLSVEVGRLGPVCEGRCCDLISQTS